MKVIKYIFWILFEEVVKECNKRVREFDIVYELFDGCGFVFFGFK